MAGFNMDDYVDVAERISLFNEKYPEGSLQATLEPYKQEGFLVGWFCTAYAYRTPDDKRPGMGHAYEPVPGKTPYTKDSEAMNAETSAWGRAIIALGFRTKKIASAQEVTARQQDPASGKAGPAARARKKPSGKQVDTGPATGTPPPDEEAVFASKEQRKELFDLKNAIGVPDARLREIIKHVTGQETTAGIPAGLFEQVKGDLLLEGAPFE